MAEVTLVPRIYSNFRGADFRGEEINLSRSPDCLNVWKDYKETESIRTRPGMKLKESFSNTVYGVFFYKVGDTEMMLVHSGDKLYKVVGSTKTELWSGLNEARSDSFIYNGIWYFKDGKYYLQYDGTTIKEVVGYIPTTSIARKPAGGGTIHEDVNLLSEIRKNTFVGDGKSTDYYLDVPNMDRDYGITVEINGSVIDNWEYGVSGIWDKGLVGFRVAPPAPLTDGQANVTITFRKKTDGYSDRIKKCTLLQVFDNRVFFSGNKDFPNTIWHCSLDDPTYCSDLDYYNEGLDSAEVRGMVAGNNALWVFREPSQTNTTVFYHTPTIDAEYGKIYPSSHSSISTGCVGKAINFNDDIVFFSDRGMEGISGDITSEQAVAHRSTLVDRKLTAERNYKDMILEEWEGYLFSFIGNKAYLADSRSAFATDTHIEYDWFFWEMEKPITCTRVNKGVLYLGTEDGIYTLTDTDKDIKSYWTTPKDKFKYPHKLKTTNKRGCVVEAKGDIDLYTKLEDTEWEFVGKYENITDSFVARIKRKKFKDIQLMFYSEKGFSLETATLECFIGGYIKR